MAKIPQDIRERTFEFALRIINLCNELNKRPGVSRDISRQSVQTPKRHRQRKASRISLARTQSRLKRLAKHTIG